jgi:hypothetical protein
MCCDTMVFSVRIHEQKRMLSSTDLKFTWMYGGLLLCKRQTLFVKTENTARWLGIGTSFKLLQKQH